MTTDGHETREYLERELHRAIAEAERRCDQLASRLAAVDLRASQVATRLRAARRIQPA
ncbi:MAG TPA: hypothetical protein VNO82_24565 [Solirubrobacteraceae bacterium]|nr:hypothetical protein [Solirubrobacteraceae bacterium]